MGPGWPLIVWASETLGAMPKLIASSITASTSDFHHSPACKHPTCHQCFILINFMNEIKYLIQGRYLDGV